MVLTNPQALSLSWFVDWVVSELIRGDDSSLMKTLAFSPYNPKVSTPSDINVKSFPMLAYKRRLVFSGFSCRCPRNHGSEIVAPYLDFH